MTSRSEWPRLFVVISVVQQSETANDCLVIVNNGPVRRTGFALRPPNDLKLLVALPRTTILP